MMTLSFTNLDDAAVRRVLAAVNNTGDATEPQTSSKPVVAAAALKERRGYNKRYDEPKKAAPAAPKAEAPGSGSTGAATTGMGAASMDLPALRQAVTNAIEAHADGGVQFKTLLDTFGVKRLGELTPEQYPGFVTAMTTPVASSTGDSSNALLD